MRNAICASLLLLSACNYGAEHEDFPTRLVLSCSGNVTDAETKKKEAAGYLIKVDPENQFQQALHYYNWEEKRFVSPCLDRGFECRIVSGPDLIEEGGSLKAPDGKVLIEEITSINRHTGKMKVSRYTVLPETVTIFEGVCEKGEMPDEQAAKF